MWCFFVLAKHIRLGERKKQSEGDRERTRAKDVKKPYHLQNWFDKKMRACYSIFNWGGMWIIMDGEKKTAFHAGFLLKSNLYYDKYTHFDWIQTRNE